MKTAIISVLILFFTIGSIYGQGKTSIAVLELDAGGISEYEAQVLTNRLRTELFKTNKFNVLERDKMDEILIEQGFQMSGCISTECAVEVGKLTGVQQMVAGTVAKIDNLFTIDIRLIDVETGKVVKTATEDCECQLKDVLTSSIKNVAERLTGVNLESASYVKKNTTQIDNSELYEWEKMGLSREEYVDFQRSGLSYEEWIKDNKMKNPATAFWLSFFLPSTGQYYNGDMSKGIIQQVLVVGGITLALVRGIDREETEGPDGSLVPTSTRNNAFFYVGFGIAAGAWAWSWLDARASAKDYNEQLEQQYGHLFQFNHNNIIYGLDFGVTKNTPCG